MLVSAMFATVTRQAHRCSTPRQSLQPADLSVKCAKQSLRSAQEVNSHQQAFRSVT